MTATTLSQIPFGEIAGALAATPHSRRMAGLIVSLCPDVGGGTAIADACLSHEFAIAAASTTNQEIVLNLLASGLLPAEKVREHAEWVTRTDAANKDVWLGESVLMALGSPLLGERAKEILNQFPASNQPNRTAIRNALLGNPLVHGDDGFPLPADGDKFQVFLKNAATFGNLKNPRLSKMLTDILLADEDSSADRDVIRDALVRREDLTEGFASMLSSFPRTIANYRALSKTPAHQKLVLDGKLPAKCFFTLDTGSIHIFSPAATELQVIQGFADARTAEEKLALLTAKQCPETIYRRVASEINLLSDARFLRESPWAKTHIDSYEKTAFWKEFRSALLDKEVSEGRGLAALSLPGLPFDVVTAANFWTGFVDKGCCTGMEIVGALRSRKFAESMFVSGDWNDLALLFAESTSGRQVEKFAELHPELAVLAACHPNGGDVSPEKCPIQSRKFIEDARRVPALVGRTGAATPGEVSGLVL